MNNKPVDFAEIIRNNKIQSNVAKQDICGFKKNGLPKGTSLGWGAFDELLTITKGQLNIMTGYSGSGKSEFMESIMMNMSKNENWNWFVYSPERHPMSNALMQFYEKKQGQPIIDRYGAKAMNDEYFQDAQVFVDEHFHIFDAYEYDVDLRFLWNYVEELFKTGYNVDGFIIDPWNELDAFQPPHKTETQWTGECLKTLRHLARKHDMSIWILAHPTKPHRNKDGSFDAPNLYSISGSANWKNKADNGLIVHRSDPTSNTVDVIVEKVKNRHYGKPGAMQFRFNYTNSCYSVVEGWDG